MRVGLKVVVGSVVTVAAGVYALVCLLKQTEAVKVENNGLKDRNRSLESERDALKTSNGSLTVNNRNLQHENSRLKAMEAALQKENKTHVRQ